MTDLQPAYRLNRSAIDPTDQIVTLRGMLDLLAVWIGIAAVAVCAARLSPDGLLGVLFYFAAIVCIGILQNGLASLSHHAVHFNLHPNRKINDLLFRWMLTAPMGQNYLVMRQEHLRHHAHFAEDDDPERFYFDLDHGNRSSPLGFILWTIAMFSGLVILSQVHRLITGDRGGENAAKHTGERAKRERTEYLYVLPAQCALFVLFYCLTGSLFGYFIFWALPLVTIGAGLNALRATIEHADPDDPATHYRTFHSNPIERLIVGPFNFNYHYEHHRFMNVPYYRVRSLRDTMVEFDDYPDCKIERSYLTRYSDILKQLRGSSASGRHQS